MHCQAPSIALLARSWQAGSEVNPRAVSFVQDLRWVAGQLIKQVRASRDRSEGQVMMMMIHFTFHKL